MRARITTALIACSVLVAACAPASTPSPTAAPAAKPTEAAKPAAATSAPAAAQPTAGGQVTFFSNQFKPVEEQEKMRTIILKDAPVKVDYKGFTVPDRFVVGYGMDLDEKHRNLPYIAAID